MLFIAFAEDTGLLPHNTLSQAFAIVVFLLIAGADVLALWPGSTATFSNLTAHKGFFPHGVATLFTGVVVVILSMSGVKVATIAAAESAEPGRNIRRAGNTVVIRIFVFFVLSTFLIVMAQPWTEIQPGKSPFVATLENIGIPGAGIPAGQPGQIVSYDADGRPVATDMPPAALPPGVTGQVVCEDAAGVAVAVDLPPPGQGPEGPQGEPGRDRADGAPGRDGQDSTVPGPPGPDGLSAYEVALDNGFEGGEAEWLASLIGRAGRDGTDGRDGIDGKDGANGANAVVVSFATDAEAEAFSAANPGAAVFSRGGL